LQLIRKTTAQMLHCPRASVSAIYELSLKNSGQGARALTDFVKIEKGLGPNGRIAVVRFDRGDNINALSPEALRQLSPMPHAVLRTIAIPRWSFSPAAPRHSAPAST
jgi:hypothetical protein